MRVTIIDDEVLGLDLVEKMLQRFIPDIEIIGKYQNPLEAIPHILASLPQLIILDAEMPHINGINLVRMMMHTGAFFLLISAHDINMLKKACGINRTYYLTKPFSAKEFEMVFLTIKNQSLKIDQHPTS
jgi:two-component SAPR family response regulator